MVKNANLAHSSKNLQQLHVRKAHKFFKMPNLQQSAVNLQQLCMRKVCKFFKMPNLQKSDVYLRQLVPTLFPLTIFLTRFRPAPSLFLHLPI